MPLTPALAPWPDRFLGGPVCLDFINTIEGPGTPREHDRLSDYAALLHWGQARGTLAAPTAARLAAHASSHSRAARTAWQHAVDLRAELRALAEALQQGHDLAPLSAALNRRFAALPATPPRLEPVAGQRQLRLALPGRQLEEALWPVLWSAAALLSSDEIGKLGQCHAASCSYFFIDHSRNHSRVWCSTEGCGNRERVKRSYRSARG
jgi:predicted RNA-binding Zn ribbon-like protein